MLAESALRLLGIRFPVADFKGSVEAAYRRLAVKLHPDKGDSPAEFRLVKKQPVMSALATPRRATYGPRGTPPADDYAQTLAFQARTGARPAGGATTLNWRAATGTWQRPSRRSPTYGDKR